MYIYQRSGWPDFIWDAAALLEPLSSVRRAQGELYGRLASLGFEDQLRTDLKVTTESVIQTSAIEGEILPPASVLSSVAYRLGLPYAGEEAPSRSVDGVVEMMLDATVNAQRPLTEERLTGWQAALFPGAFSGNRSVEAGGYRTNPEEYPMQVVSGWMGRTRVHFRAPPSAVLPAEMKQFLDWFEHSQPVPADPILRSAIAHLWFVTLHPYDDGNGRLARAITDLELARGDGSPRRFYSMSAAIQRRRNGYYDILERTQRSDLDTTEWLLWFIATLHEAIDRAGEGLRTSLKIADFWRRPTAVGLNERQHRVLTRFLDGFKGKLTTAKYAKLAKVSHDTANRDLSDLVRRNLLRKSTEGGRSTHFLIDDQSLNDD